MKHDCIPADLCFFSPIYTHNKKSRTHQETIFQPNKDVKHNADERPFRELTAGDKMIAVCSATKYTNTELGNCDSDTNDGFHFIIRWTR